MAVNTHGLKMVGLENASKETVNWEPRSGGHTQISYDRKTGDILTDDHIGSSWTVYHSSDIIPVCHTYEHWTQQEIADEIYYAVCCWEAAE